MNLSRLLCRPPVFRAMERLGVHVSPVHFYQPIPDTRTLGRHLWSESENSAGVDVDEDANEELLRTIASRFGDEWKALPRTKPEGNGEPIFYLDNGRFESVDAEMCYGLVRHFRPKKIIEIGSGFSSLLMLDAIERNAAEKPGSDPHLKTIDPYPFPGLAGRKSSHHEINAVPVQAAPLSTFETLDAGDILFIDSSHVSCIGSDVNFEVLQILPRLKKGVIVHFHDIFIPAEYPREWVMDHHRFWTEQYILQAFLAFNSAFRVIWAGHWMHLRRPDALAETIPSYDRKSVAPGSIWLERIA